MPTICRLKLFDRREVHYSDASRSISEVGQSFRMTCWPPWGLFECSWVLAIGTCSIDKASIRWGDIAQKIQFKCRIVVEWPMDKKAEKSLRGTSWRFVWYVIRRPQLETVLVALDHKKHGRVTIRLWVAKFLEVLNIDKAWNVIFNDGSTDR